MRWALAVAGLEVTWLIACESWRESAPVGLAAFLVIAWAPLVVAWTLCLPVDRRAWRRIAILAGALLAADVALDLASPYARRFAYPAWEIARVAAVAAGVLIAERLRPPAPRRPLLLAARGARAVSLAATALIPLTMLGIALRGARDESASADAAIVLGFALADDGSPRPPIVARVDRAVALLRDGTVPKLVLTGGAPKSGHTEASVMHDLAIARGAPESALVLETNARSTVENFACSKPLLERLGARRVLVVTEPWHMTRAMLLARRHGLDARQAPASSPAWRSPRHATYWLFRDAVAFLREVARDPWAAPGTCSAPDCEGCRKF